MLKPVLRMIFLRFCGLFGGFFFVWFGVFLRKAFQSSGQSLSNFCLSLIGMCICFPRLKCYIIMVAEESREAVTLQKLWRSLPDNSSGSYIE